MSCNPTHAYAEHNVTIVLTQYWISHFDSIFWKIDIQWIFRLHTATVILAHKCLFQIKEKQTTSCWGSTRFQLTLCTVTVCHFLKTNVFLSFYELNQRPQERLPKLWSQCLSSTTAEVLKSLSSAVSFSVSAGAYSGFEGRCSKTLTYVLALLYSFQLDNNGTTSKSRLPLVIWI